MQGHKADPFRFHRKSIHGIHAIHRRIPIPSHLHSAPRLSSRSSLATLDAEGRAASLAVASTAAAARASGAVGGLEDGRVGAVRARGDASTGGGSSGAAEEAVGRAVGTGGGARGGGRSRGDGAANLAAGNAVGRASVAAVQGAGGEAEGGAGDAGRAGSLVDCIALLVLCSL